MRKWSWIVGVLAHAANAATASTYLQLDNLYYAVPPGGTIEYIGDGWAAPVTSMSACHRRNGLAQQFSNFVLFYGANFDTVYLNPVSSYSCVGTPANLACVLAMTSTTGDVQCNGTVAAPDPIFANGFDGT